MQTSLVSKIVLQDSPPVCWPGLADHAWLRVHAGAIWQQLLMHCLKGLIRAELQSLARLSMYAHCRSGSRLGRLNCVCRFLHQRGARQASGHQAQLGSLFGWSAHYCLDCQVVGPVGGGPAQQQNASRHTTKCLMCSHKQLSCCMLPCWPCALSQATRHSK